MSSQQSGMYKTSQYCWVYQVLLCPNKANKAFFKLSVVTEENIDFVATYINYLLCLFHVGNIYKMTLA